MIDRKKISEMIMEALSRRGKRFSMVPGGISEYIAFGIEHPDVSNQSYRTGHLIEYLKARGLEMSVTHGVTGERIALVSNNAVHESIRQGMMFLNLRDSSLCNEGLAYNSKCDTQSSVGIDRYCAILDRLGYAVEIHETQQYFETGEQNN